jgi:hypothetical protein
LFAKRLKQEQRGDFRMQQSQEIQDYRLDHIPFLIIWIASFGVAWMIATAGVYILQEVVIVNTSMAMLNENLLVSLVLGVGMGAFLALVQPWVIRWRYGFVPRFWRIATFFGAAIGGFVFSFILDGFSAYTYGARIQVALLILLSTLTLSQTLVLSPVVRRAWPYALTGLCAWLITVISPFEIPMSILLGTMAQALFSGALFLWLMRDYRVEAVPKRYEKAKLTQSIGLYPSNFIVLWTMAHLSAWLTAIIVYVAFGSIFVFVSWLGTIVMAMIVGGVAAFSQAWLMRTQSAYQPRFWLLLSVVGSGLAAFYYEITLTTCEACETTLGANEFFSVLVWFGLPPLLQSFALWNNLRGTWLYFLAGIVSAIIGCLIGIQYSDYFLAFMIGTLAQGILTGAAFLKIMNWKQQQEQELEK